jgi:hypothetical protein
VKFLAESLHQAPFTSGRDALTAHNGLRIIVSVRDILR